MAARPRSARGSWPAPLRPLRRLLGGARRRLAPPAPEVTAWRHACRRAAEVPRRTPGEIELMGYRLRYPDLLTLCPQWEAIFVRQTLRFETAETAPRILDCGANAGLASLYFKRLYPRARITAFEADPAICQLLRANLEANGAGDVEVTQAAVWTAEGTIAFSAEGADSGAVSELPGGPATVPPAVEVPALRLADLLAAEPAPVDLVKLDIEGAEGPVLADCAGELHRVRALIAELHEFDPERRLTPPLLTLLEQAGFHYSLDEHYPLPERGGAPAGSPFAERPLCWVTAVRAWRPGSAP